MKKWIFVSIVIGLVFALTACGTAQNSSTAATATTSLIGEAQLLVGTLKLESTDLVVSSTEAAQLLPLWETLQSLAASSTAATQEIDAVVSQIEGTMSAEQISSITAMNLTQKDLSVVAADTGTFLTTSTSANSTSNHTAQPLGDAGAPGAGAPPVDMGGTMPALTGAQPAGQTQIAATQAVADQSTGASKQVIAAIINALVELLKKKIG